MSYKCTCIKWDFLIAAAHSALCSALIRFVLCSTLRCSSSSSPLPASPYLLFGSCAWPLSACVFVAQAMLLRLPCSSDLDT